MTPLLQTFKMKLFKVKFVCQLKSTTEFANVYQAYSFISKEHFIFAIFCKERLPYRLGGVVTSRGEGMWVHYVVQYHTIFCSKYFVLRILRSSPYFHVKARNISYHISEKTFSALQLLEMIVEMFIVEFSNFFNNIGMSLLWACLCLLFMFLLSYYILSNVNRYILMFFQCDVVSRNLLYCLSWVTVSSKINISHTPILLVST